MTPELKAEWVAALRSGKYTQGGSYLWVWSRFNQRVEHCCLGVLCEVAGAKRIPDGYGYEFKIDGTPVINGSYYLSQSVEQHIGFHETIGAAGISEEAAQAFAGGGIEYMGPDFPLDSLMALANDRGGRSFNEIADWIEEHL